MSDAPQNNPTRREFAKAAALAAVTPVLASLAGCAPGSPEPAPSPSPAAAPTTGAAPAAPSATPQRQDEQERDPRAEELVEMLQVRYRDRLTPEQWETVREAIEGNLRAAQSLRDFDLPITTEPAFVFRAYRGGGR